MTPVDDRAELLTFYRARVDSYADTAYRAAWSNWCRRVLAVGGSLVVPPLEPDPDLPALLAGALIHDGRRVTRRGEPNGCHSNAAKLWVSGDAVAIGTGYALSEDGLWRQHSWGLRAGGVVVETTVARLAYVGVTLTGLQALQFARSNNPRALEHTLSTGGERSRALLDQLHSLRDAAALTP